MRFRNLFLAIVALGAFVVSASGQERARDESIPNPFAIILHGNYCGLGNRGWDKPPVDALDRACQRHDACWRNDDPPWCGCHAQLRRDAIKVADDPREPEDVRVFADIVANVSDLMDCDDQAPSRFRKGHSARASVYR